MFRRRQTLTVELTAWRNILKIFQGGWDKEIYLKTCSSCLFLLIIIAEARRAAQVPQISDRCETDRTSARL